MNISNNYYLYNIILLFLISKIYHVYHLSSEIDDVCADCFIRMGRNDAITMNAVVCIVGMETVALLSFLYYIQDLPEFIFAFDLFKIDVRVLFVLFIDYYIIMYLYIYYFNIWTCSIFSTTIIMIICYIYCIICMAIYIIFIIIIFIIISS